MDRITSASKTGTTLGWTYDATGNRKTQTGTGASTYTIASASNRVSSISGGLARTYSYDAAGHATGYTAATMTYNHRGRLQTLTKAGVTVTYVYNALGQLVKQSGAAAGTVLYLYDEEGHLVGEYTGTGALIQETVWLGDIPVATLRAGGAIYYVHADHLNTPIRVTRPSDNKLMWSWSASPFGTEATNENPAGGGTFKYNLRFAGQLYDAHAGLHQNFNRDYDPAIGRYVQSDPIGLRGGIHTYAYVSSNPINRVDPSGLLVLTVQASWSEVSSLPRRLGGRTKAFIAPAKCVCKGCGNSWTLSECSAFLDIEVELRTGVFAAEAEFYRKSEGDHVADLKAGADSIRRAGEAAEQAVRRKVFSSEAACKKQASEVVTTALRAQREIVSEESARRWDASGLHTWPLSHPW